MLLYAKTDEAVYPAHEYKMCGNTIAVKTLDLDKDFIEIKKQLDGIVERYLYGKTKYCCY
jgi:5-methylcytosine-specific restriction enzyme subunit McrC